MKRVLHCRHYGRYVDDFYVVSKDKEFLREVIYSVSKFTNEELNLEIQPKKTVIIDVRYGVEFLGGFVKPYRTYLSNKTIKRMNRRLHDFQEYGTDKNVGNMVNSYLGMFSHYKSNSVKKAIMDKTNKIDKYGYFVGYYSKFIPFTQHYEHTKRNTLCS